MRAFWPVANLIGLACALSMTIASNALAEDGSFLFVATADEVSFDGETIAFDGVAQDVVMFSDRPERRTAVQTIEEFLEQWTRGPNSFEDDPPNVAISIEGLMNAPIIARLTDPQWRDELLEFDIEVLYGTPPLSGGAVTIVFDLR